MNVAPDSTFANYYHYAYVCSEALHLILMNSFCSEKTQPPVIVSMIIVALWASVAIEIQMMQPYIDLMRGHAPAKKSILLDYTREKCVDFLCLLSSRQHSPFLQQIHCVDISFL